MTECRQQSFDFQGHCGRAVVSDFGGGYLSSDGGALLLLGSVQSSGVIRALVECFRDERDGRYIEHELSALLTQRITSLVLGYEDLNDTDELRYDPLLSLVAGRADVVGLDRPVDAGECRSNPLDQHPMRDLSTGGWPDWAILTHGQCA